MGNVTRIVATVTKDDGTTGSVIMTKEASTVVSEYEPTIGDSARTIINALIPTGLFKE